MCVCVRERERETDRQTDSQTDRQTDRETETEIETERVKKCAWLQIVDKCAWELIRVVEPMRLDKSQSWPEWLNRGEYAWKFINAREIWRECARVDESVSCWVFIAVKKNGLGCSGVGALGWKLTRVAELTRLGECAQELTRMRENNKRNILKLKLNW